MAQRSGRAWWGVGVLVALTAATAWPLILADAMGGRPAYDQWNFHEPMIRTFIAEWPRLNFENYLSATTPLYHVVVAAVAQTGVLGAGTEGLRLAGSLFTLALLAVLGGACVRRGASGWQVLAVCGAFGASYYVWPSAVWLLPDNLGWLGVLTVLLLALRRDVSVRLLAAMGAACAVLVLARQVHVWTVGLVWAAAWLGSAIEAETEGEGSLLAVTPLLRGVRHRLARLVLAVAVCVPAAWLVWSFAGLWHGLVPPRFQGQYAGVSAVTPAFALSLLGLYSVAFAGWLWPVWRARARQHAGALVVAAVVGVVLAAVPESTWKEEVRAGGLWEVVAKAPVIAGRTSVVMLVMAPVGAVACVLWLARLSVRERWIMAAALGGFVASQTASPQVWQRYHEPFLLMWIALAALWDRRILPTRWAVAGPLVLIVAFGGLNAVKMRGGRADDGRRSPLASPNYWGIPPGGPKEFTDEVFPRR